MFKKEISMTVEQFFQYRRGEKTLQEIQGETELDKLVNSLNKRTYKVMVFTIGVLMFATQKASATVDGVAKAEALGMSVLNILQRAGLWICIIGCLLEILVYVFRRNGDKDEIVAIVFKWFLILLALYAVPATFIWISDFFGLGGQVNG